MIFLLKNIIIFDIYFFLKRALFELETILIILIKYLYIFFSNGFSLAKKNEKEMLC